MKETKFISQNKEKWAAFEQMSQRRDKDSNEYSKLFIQITDDLSYARTFYGNRSVRVYLNNLAQDIFQKVFNRNKKRNSFFRDFWLEDVPSIMYYQRKALLLSFLTVLLAIGIGLLTYKHDASFAEKILGEGYLEMTAENIAKKDPMAVYKQSGSIEMFIQIAANNLIVDVWTFFSGLFLSIGTVFILFRNGLMLAAFQYYFIEKGLFWESFLAVWLHGTLEISAMVICGAAGITLGKGLVFPGTYSRTQAFFSSAQRGTKIFLSVLPITIVAAIIESFLTRYTSAPNILRLSLIIISFLFIVGYYVYLPWLKNKKGTLKKVEAEKVLPENFGSFDFYKIKKLSEIILESFRFFRKYMGKYMTIILWSTILFTIISFTLNKAYLLDNLYFESWSYSNLDAYFLANGSNWFSILFPLLLSYIATYTAYLFNVEYNSQNKINTTTFINWSVQNWKKTTLNFVLQITFYILLSYFRLNMYVCLFLMPIQFIGSYILFFPFKDKRNFIASLLRILKNGVINLFALNIVFYVVIYLIFLTLNSYLFSIVYEAIVMNFDDSFIDSDVFFIVFYVLSTTFITTISFIFLSIYQGIFYFSQKEKQDAEGLLEQLSTVGTHKRNVLQK